jgi:hypothetical protein
VTWAGLSVLAGLVAIAAAAPWWVSAGAVGGLALVHFLGKFLGKNRGTPGGDRG